jgi:hypothetical protein
VAGISGSCVRRCLSGEPLEDLDGDLERDLAAGRGRLGSLGKVGGSSSCDSIGGGELGCSIENWNSKKRKVSRSITG